MSRIDQVMIIKDVNSEDFEKQINDFIAYDLQEDERIIDIKFHTTKDGYYALLCINHEIEGLSKL